MKKIVVVEDLSDWQDDAERFLKSLATVFMIGYESSFQRAMPTFEQDPPDLFVIDCMLPWSSPARDMPEAPKEVATNGYHRAGIRCQQLLKKSEKLRAIPIIFWTLITLDDLKNELGAELPANCRYVSKEAGLPDLLQTAKELLGSRI